MIVLLFLNAFASLISIISSILVLFYPQWMSKSQEVTIGERFFTQMYAARAVPFGLIVAIVPFITNIDNTVVKIILSTAMTIQIIDVIIGFKRKEIPMIIGPSIAATIHGLTAWYI